MTLLVLGFLISPVSASGSTCAVQIESLTVSHSNNNVPYSVGLSSVVSGDVAKVTYDIKDCDTGKLEGTVTVDCSKCVNEGICSRSYEITKAGCYDVVMTAYDKAGCTTTMTKEKAVNAKGNDVEPVVEPEVEPVTPPEVEPVEEPVIEPATPPEIPAGKQICKVVKDVPVKVNGKCYKCQCVCKCQIKP